MRTNSRAQYCEKCGVLCQPGAGYLYFVPDADDDDDFERIGTGREHAHWEVTCLDTSGCESRVQATADRHEAERKERSSKLVAEAAITNAEKAAKQAAWVNLIAGLLQSESAPVGIVRTGEYFDSGRNEEVSELKAISKIRKKYGA